MTKKCLICGKKFHVRPYLLKKRRGKYCSNKCRGIAMRGKSSWNKGLKLSISHKKKISEAHKKLTGEKSACWKGGKITYNGYVAIFSRKHPLSDSKGYVREHRLIAEKYLRRYLIRQEVIHHINGIKDDNRLSNLYLFNSNNKHMKFESIKIKPILKSNLMNYEN